MSRKQPTETVLERRKARAEQSVIKAARRVAKAMPGDQLARRLQDLRYYVLELQYVGKKLGALRRANVKVLKAVGVRRKGSRAKL